MSWLVWVWLFFSYACEYRLNLPQASFLLRAPSPPPPDKQPRPEIRRVLMSHYGTLVIAKELFMSGLGKEWDKAMGCRELDDKATVDPDFSSKVCEGLAFDMDLPATYNEKPIGQILLECISKGILKKGLNELLNTITDPLERMFLKKFIENSVDGYTEDAFKNIQVESKIRMYSYCKDKTLRNILNYRTVMTYEGISVPTTDFSEPFKCNAGFAYPHLSGACSCCTKK